MYNCGVAFSKNHKFHTEHLRKLLCLNCLLTLRVVKDTFDVKLGVESGNLSNKVNV